MVTSFPPLDFVFGLLFLTPGFASFKAYKHFGQVTRSYDRFDKTLITLLSSGISIVIVLFAFSIIEDLAISEIPGLDFSLTVYIFGFVSALMVAGVGGMLFGIYVDRWKYSGVDNRKETTWELTFHNGGEKEVRVVTSEGSEIHGWIYVKDSEEHGQDMLLRYPELLLRDEDGKIDEKIGIGESVFISENNLSHVYLETEVSI